MANHARKQIRDLVVALLAGLPTTGSRVLVGRTRALPADYDPSLLVYTRREKVDRQAQGLPPPLERVLTIEIVGRVQMGGVPDDILDQIAAEVEARMWTALDLPIVASVTFFGGKVTNLELVSVDLDAKVDSQDGKPGETHSGAVLLSYEATYRTAEGTPTAFA